MRNRLLGLVVMVGLGLGVAVSDGVFAQTRGSAVSASPSAGSTAWTMPRTSWGHPDIEGIWSTATLTPFERPAEMAGKQYLTVAEAAAFERDTLARTNQDRRDGGAEADVARAYNDFWWDRGTMVVPTRRTSLVVDPPDGRIPALTAEARKRVDDLAAWRKAHPADNPEDRNSWERCIARGVPTAMLPQPYNNNYQIFQTSDHVVILTEMIHDARIIPLDGRKHLPSHMRTWMGDSVGKWEGDTLVVETTNFTNQYSFRGSSEHMRLVERFTQTAQDILMYQVTIDDPAAFGRSWTVELPARRSLEPMYEYACHEANYGLEGILKGHRAEEKAAAETLAKKTPK